MTEKDVVARFKSTPRQWTGRKKSKVAKTKKKKRRDKTIKLPTNFRIHTLDADRMRYRPRGLPFFRANAGMLFHRVAYICDYFRHDGRRSHTAVHYLCNNSSFIRGESELVADPSKSGRLVCTACEFHAARKGKPSADKIVGHHVHVGKLRVEQACCEHEQHRN
jgi:hypothetical protein